MRSVSKIRPVEEVQQDCEHAPRGARHSPTRPGESPKWRSAIADGRADNCPADDADQSHVAVPFVHLVMTARLPMILPLDGMEANNLHYATLGLLQLDCDTGAGWHRHNEGTRDPNRVPFDFDTD